MTALYRDPYALAGILRERQESYEFVARGTVGYYERTLDFGAWVAGKRSQCAHGVWMKTLRELGWSYSVCNRAIKLHRLGVSAAELARDGAKVVLKRFARPRRPAGAGEAKFSAGAKFAEPLETPPGAGEADPDTAKFGAGAKFGPPTTVPESAEASAPPDEFEEPVPEGEDAAEPALPLPEAEYEPPKPLLPANYNHRYPSHRMLLCFTLHDLTATERLLMAALAERDGPDGEGALASNAQLAALVGIHKDSVSPMLGKCRSAGYLRSINRRNHSQRHLVFPDGPPVERQLQMVLMRSFDAKHRASPAEAAESAAARPPGGDRTITPGVAGGPAGGDRETTRGVAGGPPLTGKGTRKETGRRGTRAGREIPQPDSPHPPETIQAFGIWNEVAAGTGMRPAVELDAERAAKLKARLRDAGGMDEFRAVCERAGKSKALTGRKPGSWPADLDQFLEPRFFRRVREGGWDDAPGELEHVAQALRDADPEELRAEVLMSPLAGDAPGLVAALCDRVGVGWVRSWLKDCRLESRGKTDAALLFASGFAADRVDRDYGDTVRDLWRELHGGELVLETRKAA